MEWFLSLVFVAIVFGAWLAHRRRKNRKRAEESARWAELTRRVYELERTVSELRSTVRVATEVPDEAERFTAATASAVSVVPAAPVLPPIITPEHVPAAATPPTPASVPVEAAETTSASSEIPTSRRAEPAASWFARLKDRLDLEEALGRNLANKFGIILLVFGVAFLISSQLKQVGPAGKVLVGVLVSAALIGGGVFLERKSGYRLIGRAGIGGGWALAFFTSYAMYHVEATRVFSSQAPDLLLMLLVAAGMVAHTLHYRSQVVTGLAFLLAFSTLTISQVTVYSLAAGAILALGLVVIVGRMQWFELEIFGIIAAYGTHWWWLRRIIEPMQGHKHPFPEFFTSACILLFYWATFRTSYILRRCDARQERVSTIAALLNSAALLALMKYQSVHPEWAFWALLAIGAVELGLSMLPVTRRRRSAFLVLATIGVTLLLAALPFRFTGARLDALWLLEAEALLLVGMWVREILFRRLGMLASLLAPIYLLAGEAGFLLGYRQNGYPATRDLALAILCAISAAVFYANSHYVTRRWPSLFEPFFDRTMMHRASFVGAVLLWVGAWAAFPESLTAVAWAGVGAGLFAAGRRLGLQQLPFEAHFFFANAFIASCETNLLSTDSWAHVSVRLLTVTVIAAAFYVSSRWASSGLERVVLVARWLPIAYRWLGSALLFLLAFYALNANSVAPAWVVLGLTLLEVGVAYELGDLRLQGYVALACSFIAIFFVNLNSDAGSGAVRLRLDTVAPVVLALYYVFARLSSAHAFKFEQRFRVAEISSWCGAASLLALLRFEVSLDWVAATWALCSFVLLAVAWKSNRAVFLYQALAFAALATFRACLHNLYERSYLPGPFWHSRLVCAGATALILFAGLAFAFRLRKGQEPARPSRSRFAFLTGLARRPEQVFFFLPLGLMVVMLAVVMRRGLITVSWSALGVIVFLFALWVGERSFRLAGLTLLLLGVGKIVVVDVWDLNPRDRYLTFITMGSALLLVSFLYSRYREALRRYL